MNVERILPNEKHAFANVKNGGVFFHDGALCMRIYSCHPERDANYVNLKSGYLGSLGDGCAVEIVIAKIIYY